MSWVREFFEGFDHTDRMNLVYFGYIFVIYLSMIAVPDNTVAMRIGDNLVGALLTKIVSRNGVVNK